MNPSTISGSACRKEVYNLVCNGASFWFESLAFNSGRAPTRPAEKTKEPTPTSINDVPHVSTFANRRGKRRKSTARMAMQVTTIIAPRYVVRKGFLGRGFDRALSAAFLETGLVDVEGGFACLGSGVLGMKRMIATGPRRRALRRRGLSA